MGFVAAPIQNFIGQGIIFPLEIVNGSSPLRSGFDLLQSSITTILSWKLGRRFLLTQFGSALDQLLEEPNDASTANDINIFVVDAVSQWEQRVEKVSSVLIVKSQTEIDVEVTFQIKGTQTPLSFVFPFYTKLIY